MAQRKYRSEFAVSLFTARFQIIWPSGLMSGDAIGEREREIAELCHIYLICKRPATSFEPKNFQYENGLLKGNITYKKDGKPKLIPFETSFPLMDGASELRLEPYPHREFRTYRPNGEGVRYMPSNAFSMGFDIAAMRELEVLYVGQAYGDGDRSAIDRLRSHSTLQKILADVQYKYPDDEVVLATFEYCPYAVITMIDGTSKPAIDDDEQDGERYQSIFSNPLSKHQQICLAEAGLIRLFRPEYNEIYKASFPASDQKILLGCYELDFSALIVEIDTSELGLPLFSASVKADVHHIAKFDLIDPTARQSFFTFDDGGFKMDGVQARTR